MKKHPIFNSESIPLWWKCFVIGVGCLFVCSLFALFFYLVGLKSVPLGNFALRKNLFSNTYSHILSSGYHFELPFFTKISLIPQTVHSVFVLVPVETSDGGYASLELHIVLQYQAREHAVKKLIKLSEVDGFDDFVKQKTLALWEKNFIASQSYREEVGNVSQKLKDALKQYGIKVYGILLADTPDGLLGLEKFKTGLQVARQKYQVLQLNIKTLKAQNDGELLAKSETVAFQNQKLLIKAEHNKFKKEAEADFLVAEALSEVEREKRQLLETLDPELQSEVLDKWQKMMSKDLKGSKS